MAQDVFKFRVKSISVGWCEVVMTINGKEIPFTASYLGDNPLASLIEACAKIIDGWTEYKITWEDEPGTLDIDLSLDDEDVLHFDILLTDESGDEDVVTEWHEAVPSDTVISAVISEGFRVLNAFGLYGYRNAWMNHEDFPLTEFLHVVLGTEYDWEKNNFTTDISEEVQVIRKHISKMRTKKKREMDECTVYYDAWQMQCCGDPFSVGDKVDWTCIAPSERKNAHGIIIDFDEDHHAFATHSITGTVVKIIAERSESPKGEGVICYEDVNIINEEIQRADGRESVLEDDDTTVHSFWGYIVELKDVTVKKDG